MYSGCMCTQLSTLRINIRKRFVMMSKGLFAVSIPLNSCSPFKAIVMFSDDFFRVKKQLYSFWHFGVDTCVDTCVCVCV